MAEPDEVSSSRRALCPICQRPSEPAMRPFCSKRCADIDLHRWLAGSYVVPSAPADDEEAPDDHGPEE